MEFVNLSNYIKVKNAKVHPFSEIRNMKLLELTNNLEMVNTPENISYAESLADNGFSVVKIRRVPTVIKYMNRKDFPRRICFEMTSRCNFSCAMCPQQNLKRPLMDMDADKYMETIDEIDHYGIEGLWLYQFGESLLHPKFNRILEHIKTKTNLGYIWLSTNGEFCSGKNLETIMNSNIDFLNFSVNAVTHNTYKSVTQNDKFEIVQSNLEKLLSLKKKSSKATPFIRLQMIEQESTKHEIDDFIRKYYTSADIVSINMLEHVNLPGNDYGFNQRDRKDLSSCTRISRNDCFIWSNGVVSPCDAAYNGEINIGNINDHSLYEVWNSIKHQKILKLNEKGEMSKIDFCKNCTDYDI